MRGQSAGGGNGRGQGEMIESLEAGFMCEVADMLHGERQLVTMLPRMAQSASTPSLRDALARHAEETEEHARRLEDVFQLLNRRPYTDVCEGIQGILTEGKDLIDSTEPGPVRDALLVGAAQKVEHYEMSSYGTLVAWAEQLGENQIARLLEQTLNEEKIADRNLTRIAESTANAEASQREYRRDVSRPRSEGVEPDDDFGRRTRERMQEPDMRGSEPGNEGTWQDRERRFGE